jgi:hypothetical protein
MTYLAEVVQSPPLKARHGTPKTPRSEPFKAKNPYVTNSPTSERPRKRPSLRHVNGPPFERFFSALLRSSVTEYFKASCSHDKEKSKILWERICYRLDLNINRQPIQSRYRDLPTHCIVRASLVLEEARNEICAALLTIHQRDQQELRQPEAVVRRNRTVRCSKSAPQRFVRIILDVQKITESFGTNETSCIVCFKAQNPFSVSELDTICPGSVFVCTPNAHPLLTQTENSFLGVVVAGTIRKNVMSSQRFSMDFFLQKDFTNVVQSPSVVSLTHVSQMVTSFR